MAATKEKPFVNSLGMKFVPIPGTKVLFCIWETRVKDFEAFVKDSGYGWSAKPPFEQGSDHPVVMVSWDDAKAFCAWLSKKEGVEYRLPTDEEWDGAVGKDKYSWGNEWPPPKGAENIGGEEVMLGSSDDPKSALWGYRDDYPRTAPVGSTRANKFGLYDMGGNVRQWMEDWYTEAHYKKSKDGGGYDPKPEDMAGIRKGGTFRATRGGNWLSTSTGHFVSSICTPYMPQVRYNGLGFRCALVAPAPFPALAEAAPTLKLERPNIRGRVVVWPLYKGVKDEPGLAQLPEELKTADDVCSISASYSNGSEPQSEFAQGVGMALRADGSPIVWGSVFGSKTVTIPRGMADIVAILAKPSTLSMLRENGRVVKIPPHKLIAPSDLGVVVRLYGSESGLAVYALRTGGSVVAFGEPDQVRLIPGDARGVIQAHGYVYRDDAGFVILDHDGVLRADGIYRGAEGTRRIASFLVNTTRLALLDRDGDVLIAGKGYPKPDDKTFKELPPIRKLAGRMRAVYENMPRQKEWCFAAMDRKGEWHFVGDGLDVKGCEEASKNCIAVEFGNEHAIGLKVDDIKAAMAAEDEYEAKIRALLAPGAASAEGRGTSDEGKTVAQTAPIPSGTFTPDEAKELDGILSPLREAMASAKGAVSDRIARYVKDLEELEGKAAARSDLDAVLRLRKEREGWAAGQRVPKADASARMPSEYSNLRYFLDRDLGLADGRAESAIKRETSKAVSGLRSFEAKLTRAKRIEAALAVREIAAKVEKGEVPGAVGADVRAEPAAAPISPALGSAASSPKDATKEGPFVNSLGMRFVPIKGTKVLFSVWETRVRDFEAFVKESGYKWSEKAGFEQTPEDPVVMVSWTDAKAFCAWLSKKDGLEYRLPTDDEWDKAVGNDKYPWGDEWPPPKKTENLAGEECQIDASQDLKRLLAGYKDDHPYTAPVGSYKMTKAGLCDIGGNVREWVEDWYTQAHYEKHRESGGYEIPSGQLEDIKQGNVRRISRGGCWNYSSPQNFESANRAPSLPDGRVNRHGFRCVLELP